MPKTLIFLPLLLCLAEPLSAQSLQERLLQAEDSRAVSPVGRSTSNMCSLS